MKKQWIALALFGLTLTSCAGNSEEAETKNEPVKK
jgi:hypothetical protein